MRVLVLGGYGLIGSAITKFLLREGHVVTGLGRTASKGETLIPAAAWIGADISKLTHAESWLPHLENIDAVVNASGALQNGLKDDVSAVQRDAVLALIKACEQKSVSRFVQISAPGAEEDSSTEFYRSKAAADTALKSSALEWTIFRPGLVISPHAYGGTSLLRMLAAFPFVQPIILATAPIQTVSIEDVAAAVSLAIKDRLFSIDVDLVEDGSHSLADVTLKFRRWLGFNRPKFVWHFPAWIGRLMARGADVMGWLGWRSALRTTALKVLSSGVAGDPNPWRAASGKTLRPLAQTLDDLPSTLQERVYARAMLAFPLLLLILSGFWFASGLIGFAQHTAAAAKLKGTMPVDTAAIFVSLGSSADVIIGAALLFRPTTRVACFASIALSAAYLAASAWFTPHLWADPLGPMVKVFPAIGLALIIAALTQER